MLRRRGENVSPAEVEEAIQAHPDVLECAVVGVPSELSEEEIKAFVVPAPGRAPDFAALRDVGGAGGCPRSRCRGTGRQLDALPRTPTARIARHRLPTGHPDGEYDAGS